MPAELDQSTVRTEVKILGKSYLLRSEVDPGFAGETAKLVNHKMRELMEKSSGIPTERIAILTAMNLAGELLKSRKESTELRSSLKQRAKKLLSLIDNHL